MAKDLFILNDSPYGTERNYNALRLARSLLNAGQKVPQGYYNIGDMLGALVRRKREISVCGMSEVRRIVGARRGTMDILTEWTQWADKLLVF